MSYRELIITSHYGESLVARFDGTRYTLSNYNTLEDNNKTNVILLNEREAKEFACFILSGGSERPKPFELMKSALKRI